MDKNSIIVGRISSIDYKNGCADVIFPDLENLIKTNLPFFSFEYRMPKVNELVVVLFYKEQGVILGPIFNLEYLPELYGKNNYFKRFSERACMKYDDESGVLTIEAPKIKFVQTEV